MKQGWEQFRIALGILTVLPHPRGVDVTPLRIGRSMALFPAVGLLLGLGLVVIDSLLGVLLPRAVLDCLLLLILIAAGGALHLEGFAELLDGMTGGRKAARGRSGEPGARTGVSGLVCLVLLMLLKFLCLFHLPVEGKSAGLIFMPAAGRWVQVVLAVSCRRLRRRSGDAASFLEHAGERELLMACGSLIAVAMVLFGLKGVFLVFLLGISTIFLIKYFEMGPGGVTGESLGAGSELMEIVALLLVLTVMW